MYYVCNDCPRSCNATRTDLNGSGICGAGALPHLVRAAPHYGEEPCISGTNGSGTIFFSGCNLHCVYCQNDTVSRSVIGEAVDKKQFLDIVYSLEAQNVHNINLVTPSHHIRFIVDALKNHHLKIPIVWNSSGYESVEALRSLEGIISIYMPDYKYLNSTVAKKYSLAENYPTAAELAIKEMVRQTGPFIFDENGILKQGVLIRHLILPGELDNSKSVMDWLSLNLEKDCFLISLMSQYTPIQCYDNKTYANLNRRLTKREYDIVFNYMLDCGIDNGYYQSPDSSSEKFIPEFDGTGVKISVEEIL